MATYQDPKTITITLDKQKLFDHLKLMFADPEKVKMNVDDVLKAASVGGEVGGQDVEMKDIEAAAKGGDYDEKVVKIHKSIEDTKNRQILLL